MKKLRRRYVDRTNPERFVGPPFTICEQHKVHEAIAGSWP